MAFYEGKIKIKKSKVNYMDIDYYRVHFRYWDSDIGLIGKLLQRHTDYYFFFSDGYSKLKNCDSMEKFEELLEGDKMIKWILDIVTTDYYRNKNIDESEKEFKAKIDRINNNKITFELK